MSLTGIPSIPAGGALKLSASPSTKKNVKTVRTGNYIVSSQLPASPFLQHQSSNQAAPDQHINVPSSVKTINATALASVQNSDTKINSVSFDDIFKELEAFRQENNSLTIPVTHPSLLQIIDSLTANCIEDLVQKRWDDQMAALTRYKLEHGNSDVPITHPTLGSWVKDQREFYKLHGYPKPNPLTKNRVQRLKDEAGFQCNKPTRWDIRFQELNEYKEVHGHCDVPIDYPHLGVWVLNQRFNLLDMPKERIGALDSLGFNWNCNKRNRSNGKWDAQYSQLVQFVNEHHHANVPPSYKKLGKWVKNQRYEYTKFHKKEAGTSKLNRNRIDKLEEVGFQWKIRASHVINWEERFEVRANLTILLVFKHIYSKTLENQFTKLLKWRRMAGAEKFQRTAWPLCDTPHSSPIWLGKPTSTPVQIIQ